MFHQHLDGVQSQRVSDWLVVLGIKAFHRDTELADSCGQLDAERSGGQRLAVDDDYSGGGSLAGNQYLATQLFAGESAATTAQLSRSQRCGNRYDGNLFMGCFRDKNLIRRLKSYLVVRYFSSLSQQHGNAFAGVTGAAAANCHQDIRLQLSGYGRCLFQHLNVRVGHHSGEQTDAEVSQCFLDSLHHVGMLQNCWATNHQGP